MKTIRMTFIAMLLCFIMVFLTGCTHDIVGTWQLTGGNAVQAIYSISDPSQLSADDADATFTFAKNGSLTIIMKRDGIENTVDGSWSEEGDNITISIEGQSVLCSWDVDGDTLNLFFSLYEQNANFTFTRK